MGHGPESAGWLSGDALSYLSASYERRPARENGIAGGSSPAAAVRLPKSCTVSVPGETPSSSRSAAELVLPADELLLMLQGVAPHQQPVHGLVALVGAERELAELNRRGEV